MWPYNTEEAVWLTSRRPAPRARDRKPARPAREPNRN